MPKHAAPVSLDGHSLTLAQARTIAEGASVGISSAARRRVDRARGVVEDFASGTMAVYGVNTGFGFLAGTKIDQKELKELQQNILRSHAAGHGNPLSIEETRLALALRLNLLIKGFSGVRYELCELVLKFLEKGIYPVVPELGSVGASGDLIPLAHLGLPLIGESRVFYGGKEMPAREALKAAKLKPLQLAEKEGLSFVNGTEIMQAVGGLALANALILAETADKIAALSYEGMEALLSPLDPIIHKARGQRGQALSAKTIENELRGSYLERPKRSHARVQDPYSLRCAPQIHGPSRDALDYSKSIIERELNAVTDNPLVDSERGRIVSGGNFHGQALAMAFDIAAIAAAELGNVSERRLELLLNPHFSNLPAFLSRDPGKNSGYMALQYLSASLVNENKVLSHPASTDSIPGNVGVEDHVSMGMTAARKLRKIADNVKTILAVEMLAAAQAIDIRGIKKLGVGTKRTYALLRTKVKPLADDRVLAPEIESARKVLATIGAS